VGASRNTPTVRLPKLSLGAICVAPERILNDLLGAEGFNDIRYVAVASIDQPAAVGGGTLDFALNFVSSMRQIGHLVVDSAVDRPWSQYFCCLLYGNADYVQKHPLATKRVIRAVLKATDICASQPEAVALQLVDDGDAEGYDRILQVLRELPYDRWREYDPEDTVRYYALRLHEVGLIKSTPNKIIAQGTNWRFLDELKRELKA